MIFFSLSHGIRLNLPYVFFLAKKSLTLAVALLITMVEYNISLPYATLIHMIIIKLTSTNYLLWRNQVENSYFSRFVWLS